MSHLEKYEAASLERVKQARQIAKELFGNKSLHRLAMRAVFVLEDTHEALSRLSTSLKTISDTEAGKPVRLP